MLTFVPLRSTVSSGSSSLLKPLSSANSYATGVPSRRAAYCFRMLRESITAALQRELWPWRYLLANRATFQGVMEDPGLQWWDYMQFTVSAYSQPLSITFAFVATHNHFVLDRGGNVVQSVRTGDQAAGERDRGRPSRAARRPQQLHRLLLAQAGEPEQGKWRHWRRNRRRGMGTSIRVHRNQARGVPASCDSAAGTRSRTRRPRPATRRCHYPRGRRAHPRPDDRASRRARLGRVSPVWPAHR